MAPVWYSAIRPDPLVPRDFFADYASARNLLLGKSVYTPLAQSVKAYLGFDAQTNFAYSGHTPPSILLALPLARFDFVTAGLWWNVLSLALLLSSAALVARQLRWPLSVYTVPPMVALLMIWPPLWHHILLGQQELVLLALISLAWIAARNHRDGWSGILLGIATSVKFFPALLLVYFVVRRRWRVALSGLSAFLASTLVALIVVGRSAYLDYMTLSRNELSRWYGNDSNASLTGFVMRLVAAAFAGAPWLAQLLIAICWATILGLLVAASFRSKADLDLEFSAATAAMLLLSPITWSEYFVLLLLPLVLWGNRLYRREEQHRHLAGLAAAWALLSFPGDGLRLYLGAQGVSWIRSPVGHLLLTNLSFLGLALFFALQVWWLLKVRPESPEARRPA